MGKKFLFFLIITISFVQSSEYKIFSEKSDNYSLKPLMVTCDPKSGSIYYLMDKKEYVSWYFKYKDTYLIKLSSTLDSLWKISLTNYTAYSIISIKGNGVLITGDSTNYYTYNSFKCLTRIDSTGRILWNKKAPASFHWIEEGLGVVETDTTMVLASLMGESPNCYLSVCKVSLDSSAKLIKQSDSSNNFKITEVKQLFLNDSGGIDVFCHSASDTSDNDINLVCFDSELNIKQIRKFPGEGKDIFEGALPTGKSSYLVWGQTNSCNPYNSTAYFGKTNYFISETSTNASNYLEWFKCSNSTSLTIKGIQQSSDKWLIYLNQGIGISRMYIGSKGDSLDYNVLTPSNVITISGVVPLSENRTLLFGEKTLSENKYGTWITTIGNTGELPIELTPVIKMFPPQRQLYNFANNSKSENFLLSGKKLFNSGHPTVGSASSMVINNRVKVIMCGKKIVSQH